MRQVQLKGIWYILWGNDSDVSIFVVFLMEDNSCEKEFAPLTADSVTKDLFLQVSK